MDVDLEGGPAPAHQPENVSEPANGDGHDDADIADATVPPAVAGATGPQVSPNLSSQIPPNGPPNSANSQQQVPANNNVGQSGGSHGSGQSGGGQVPPAFNPNGGFNPVQNQFNMAVQRQNFLRSDPRLDQRIGQSGPGAGPGSGPGPSSGRIGFPGGSNSMTTNAHSSHGNKHSIHDLPGGRPRDRNSILSPIPNSPNRGDSFNMSSQQHGGNGQNVNQNSITRGRGVRGSHAQMHASGVRPGLQAPNALTSYNKAGFNVQKPIALHNMLLTRSAIAGLTPWCFTCPLSGKFMSDPIILNISPEARRLKNSNTNLGGNDNSNANSGNNNVLTLYNQFHYSLQTQFSGAVLVFEKSAIEEYVGDIICGKEDEENDVMEMITIGNNGLTEGNNAGTSNGNVAGGNAGGLTSNVISGTSNVISPTTAKGELSNRSIASGASSDVSMVVAGGGNNASRFDIAGSASGNSGFDVDVAGDLENPNASSKLGPFESLKVILTEEQLQGAKEKWRRFWEEREKVS